ncbi:MAG TPA: DUF58 domain-containing protein [Nitrospirae bacterium]|nr:DUF58 domain-containing protein [Nitrospirota bacterium]
MTSKAVSDLPARIREIEIRARKVVNNILSGEYHSIFKGHGMEFSEVRPYQPGDDIRSMDWNVTARYGEPFIKVFHEERELVMTLLVDMSASGDFGSGERFKSEIAAELCAVLAFSAIKNNDKVGLIAFTDKVELYIAPKKGRTHVLRLIRELLYFRPERSGTSIVSALDYLNKVITKKSIVFLVSDFMSGNYQSALRATAKKHDLIAVRMSDPREESLPETGLIAMRDAETGASIVIDTSDRRLRAEFSKAIEEENRDRDRMLASASVDQVVISSDKSYIEPLIKFFKLREKRRRFG